MSSFLSPEIAAIYYIPYAGEIHGSILEVCKYYPDRRELRELEMYLFFIYTAVRGSTIIKTGKIWLLLKHLKLI